MSAHQEWRVGRPRNRGEYRRNRVQSALAAEPRESREGTRIYRGRKDIGPRTIGNEDDDTRILEVAWGHARK